MYATLLIFHSVFRWLVLLALCYAILLAYIGFKSKPTLKPWDDKVRHWTATIAHVQLLIGITLYSQSPIVSFFWGNLMQTNTNLDSAFFGLIHMILMLVAIVIITIGSALAKRRIEAKAQYKTMLVWFSIALFIILIAIPWPFSPLANRPYFR